MTRLSIVAVASLAVALGVAGRAAAQDTPAAKATRERLKKIILDDLDYKEEMTRIIFDDLKRESDNKVSFKIDTTTGMSMNTRLTYKAKNVSLEKVLNDLSDKNGFGWFVYSNPKDPNDRYNGWVVLRKADKKERGYPAGKEPKETKEEKKTSRLDANPNVEIRNPKQIQMTRNPNDPSRTVARISQSVRAD
jgi:hypothetical protein